MSPPRAADPLLFAVVGCSGSNAPAGSKEGSGAKQSVAPYDLRGNWTVTDLLKNSKKLGVLSITDGEWKFVPLNEKKQSTGLYKIDGDRLIITGDAIGATLEFSGYPTGTSGSTKMGFETLAEGKGTPQFEVTYSPDSVIVHGEFFDSKEIKYQLDRQ